MLPSQATPRVNPPSRQTSAGHPGTANEADRLALSASRATAGSGSADRIEAVVESATLPSTSLQEFQESLRQLALHLPDQAAQLTTYAAEIQNVHDFVARSPELLSALQVAFNSEPAPVNVDDTAEGSRHGGGARSNVRDAAAALGVGAKNIATSPMTWAIGLSCLSTALKTAAWYGHTIIPDNRLLAPGHAPHRDVALTAIKTALSWGIALAEYIPLTMANRVADKAGISLTSLRGVIEAMDLGWFVGFLKVVKHEPLNWHHYLGLVMAGAGCTIMNKPSSFLPGIDEGIARTQARAGNAIRRIGGRLRGAGDLERNDESRSPAQVGNRQADVQALLERLGPIQTQLQTVRDVIRAMLPAQSTEHFDRHVGQRLSDMPQSEAGTAEVLAAHLARIDDLISESPQTSAVLRTVRDSLNELSTQAPDTLKKIFAGGWLVGEAVFAGVAAVLLKYDRPMGAALTLSAGATGVKTVAWYAHTVVPDDKLLPTALTPAGPLQRELAHTAVKIAMSWAIAMFEYIPLTLAHRTADQHDINLAKVRGAIAAMDLVWLAAFMLMVKGEKLEWQHFLGLTLAGAGVAVANAG